MANSGALVGKVALITGGSRGIGAAIVRRLAMKGATVAFTYSSSPEKAKAYRRRSTPQVDELSYQGRQRRRGSSA